MPPCVVFESRFLRMIGTVSLAGKPSRTARATGCAIRAKTYSIDIDAVLLRAGESMTLHGGLHARSFWHANRGSRCVGTDGKIRICSGLCTRFLRPVGRLQRIVVILDRKRLRAGTLVCSLRCVRRKRRVIAVLDKIPFSDCMIAHPVQQVGGQIGRFP